MRAWGRNANSNRFGTLARKARVEREMCAEWFSWISRNVNAFGVGLVEGAQERDELPAAVAIHNGAMDVARDQIHPRHQRFDTVPGATPDRSGAPHREGKDKGLVRFRQGNRSVRGFVVEGSPDTVEGRFESEGRPDDVGTILSPAGWCES